MSYNRHTHADFRIYFDKVQKRNYWLLGYFGGGAVNISEAMELAKDYAKTNFVPLESIKIDEVLKSRSYQGYKFIYSNTIQEPDEKATTFDNVWEVLTR